MENGIKSNGKSPCRKHHAEAGGQPGLDGNCGGQDRLRDAGEKKINENRRSAYGLCESIYIKCRGHKRGAHIRISGIRAI